MRYPFLRNVLSFEINNPKSLSLSFSVNDVNFHGQNHNFCGWKGRFVMVRHRGGVFVNSKSARQVHQSLRYVMFLGGANSKIFRHASSVFPQWSRLGNIKQYLNLPPLHYWPGCVFTSVGERVYYLRWNRLLVGCELVFKTCFYFVFISDDASPSLFNFNEDSK